MSHIGFKPSASPEYLSSSAQVVIETTPLSFRLDVAPNGMLHGTSLYVNNFCSAYIEKQWDHRRRCYIPVRKYRYYNEKFQKLHLPKFDLGRFCSYLSDNGLTYRIKDIPLELGAPIAVELKPGISDLNDLQTRAINYLSTSPDAIKGLALQTGCIGGDEPVQVFEDGEVREYRLSYMHKIFNDEKARSFRGWDSLCAFSNINGTISYNRIRGVTYSGVQQVFRLITAGGLCLKLTGTHLVMTDKGYREATDCVGRLVLCSYIREGERVTEYQLVDSIEDVGEIDVYDIECDPEHPNFVVGGIVVHNSGKTYSAIKTIARIGRRAIIMVPGMVDQWSRSIFDFTTLKEEDVYIIKGEKSISTLLRKIDKEIFPKIILCSIGTIRNYANDKEAFDEYPPFDELCQLLRIGVRITDETHLNFHANLMIDLRLAPAQTIVLTATFDNSRPEIKRIFDSHYPSEIRYGENEYRKYVAVREYRFGWTLDEIPSKFYKGKDGYSHAMLEGYLLKKDDMIATIFDRVYVPILQNHYFSQHQPGRKLLILCISVAMCTYIQQRIRKLYPGFTTNIYIAETDDSVLAQSDIIVSTPFSAGTGRDIKGLYTVFLTASIRSAPLSRQILGRLRWIADDVVPQFCYCTNVRIPPQVEHARVRQGIYEPLALVFDQCNLLT